MRAIIGVVILSFMMLVAGCMSFDVENHPKGMDLTASSPKGGIETIHGSFYGFYWKPRTQEDIIKAKGDTQLYRVTYHSNFFYSLAAVCSLGLYVPETIEWKLVTAPEDDGPVM